MPDQHGGRLDSDAGGVKQVDLPCQVGPNVEQAVLVTTEEGTARLTLLAHPDDPDPAPIAMVWTGAIAARMEPPNDEARRGQSVGDTLPRDYGRSLCPGHEQS